MQNHYCVAVSQMKVGGVENKVHISGVKMSYNSIIIKAAQPYDIISVPSNRHRQAVEVLHAYVSMSTERYTISQIYVV